MLKKQKTKVGAREFFALYAMTMALQFSDQTPATIFKDAKNAGWMVPIIAGILTLVSFSFVLLVLSKYKDKNMIEIIYITFGKYIGFILCFILFIVAFAAIVLNSRSYVDITRTMFLPKTPTNVIYFMLIAAAYMIGRGGLRGISSTAWLFFVPMCIVIIIMSLLSFKDINMYYIYPIWGPGVKEILKVSVRHTGVFGELILFTIFFSEVRSYKCYKAASLTGAAFTIVVLAVFSFIYITVFDYVSLENMAFPFQELTMIVNIEQFFTNLGSLFFWIWIMLSVIRCTVLLYLATSIFCYMLNIKEIKPLLPALSAIIFILGNMPNSSLAQNITSKADVFYQLTYYILLLLPFILWILSKIRKVAGNES
jgi:spore germination protein (amino acid permease)